MIERALAGFVLAGAIAWGARKARSLATSGAIAATIVGTLAIAAGWSWGAILILFFASSSALTRWRKSAKERRTGGIVEKGGTRDAVQVLANGGLFAASALGAVIHPWNGWMAIGGGAIAAAAADTWATEIGTAIGKAPRSILTLRPLEPGTSGGITLPGTLASIIGAAALGAAALLVGWPTSMGVGMFVGGVAGSLADSLLGATLQERRRCENCGAETERKVHSCGGATRVIGGVAGFGNDLVNLASVAAGAVVALLVMRGWHEQIR